MPKRLNADEYDVYCEQYNSLDEWMAINEVNLVEINDKGVVFEFALWARGVRRWCKSVVAHSWTDDIYTYIYDIVVNSRFLADKQTKELGYKCED